MSDGKSNRKIRKDDKSTELLCEVCYTLVGDEVVSPLPVEDLLEEALGLERLDDHHDVQVSNVGKLLVLR